MEKKKMLGCALIITVLLVAAIPSQASFALPSGLVIGGVGADYVVAEYYSGTTDWKDVYAGNGDLASNTVIQFFVDCGSVQTVDAFILTNHPVATLYNVYEFKIYTPTGSGTFDATQASSYDLANPVYSGIGVTSDPIYYPTDRTATLNASQTSRYFLFEIVSNAWILSQPGQSPYAAANFGSLAVVPEPVSIFLFGLAGAFAMKRRK